VAIAGALLLKARGPASPAGVAPVASVSQTSLGPDAIVIDSGIAGLSAAYEFAQGGANVTIIDMASVFGGPFNP
jgi:NADPH-dependent 2,4-dienoyl-CoA reductase/sulfur reductase-like enzyme